MVDSQFKGNKPVHAGATLQGGGYPHTLRHYKTRRLLCKGGLKGHILCNTHLSKLEKFSEIHDGRQSLSIKLPFLWAVECTMGLHQDPETSSSGIQRAGSQDRHLCQ